MAGLKQLLERLRHCQGKSEIALALLTMIGAGQIKFELVRHNKKLEKAFMASVPPVEIAGLLRRVTDPVACVVFSHFLEGLLCIRSIRGDETDILFGPLDAFLARLRAERRRR